MESFKKLSVARIFSLRQIHHAGGESAIVTFAPIRESTAVKFAAIGLTDMLNCGGAVLDCQLRHVPSTNGRDARKGSTTSNISGKPPYL